MTEQQNKAWARSIAQGMLGTSVIDVTRRMRHTYRYPYDRELIREAILEEYTKIIRKEGTKV